MSASVAVVGAGGWGTALSMVLAWKGTDVLLWAREPEVVDAISRHRENRLFLPGVEVPPNVTVTGDLSGIAGHANVVMAVPSHGLRDVASRLSGCAKAGTVFTSVTKGFEVGTGLRPSEIIRQVLDVSEEAVCVLSGPSHAEEVSRGVPTAVVAASAGAATAARVQKLFFAPRFRVYTHTDPLGVELGGALKNIIAIACGIGAGLGFGDNTQAALVTRGLAEITRLGCALGARRETFGGLAGLGDLVVTCTSRHSRNRRLGARLGAGETLDGILQGMADVAEGVRACQAAVGLARQRGVPMPITEEVHGVLFEGRRPAEALASLLSREARSEEERSS